MDSLNNRDQLIEQKRQHWREHIARWQQSGLNPADYCRQHRLAYHQFLYWRGKYAAKPAPAFSLVELTLPTVSPSIGENPRLCPLRVTLRPALGIEVFPGFDPRTLQQVVIALRELG